MSPSSPPVGGRVNRRTRATWGEPNKPYQGSTRQTSVFEPPSEDAEHVLSFLRYSNTFGFEDSGLETELNMHIQK